MKNQVIIIYKYFFLFKFPEILECQVSEAIGFKEVARKQERERNHFRGLI